MNAVYVLLVAAGGFVGAPARYLVDRAVTSRFEPDFPLGTLIVNVSGSLALGLLAGLSLSRHLSPLARVSVGTGFCGAYTTFSTFTFETVRLMEDGLWVRAVANVAGSIIAGLGFAAAGLAIGLAA